VALILKAFAPDSIFGRDRQMNDRCRFCRKNLQTSPSRPQQAVGSQLSASDNVGPNHRQKMASDPFYQPACLESPRNWRAAHPVRFTGSNIARTIPSTERNRQQQNLRDQGESCKQQLGFRRIAFRETIDSGSVVAQSERLLPIPSSPAKNSNLLLLLAIP
jgi:hypothetical protein